MSYSDDKGLRALVGIQVAKASISKDSSVVELITEDGAKWYLSAVGDCCSSSWFEHVTGFVAPFTITKAKTTEWLEPHTTFTQKDDWDRDIIKVYSLVLKTNKGTAELELRNKSNGYYGGEVKVSIDAPLTQYSEPFEPKGMRPITQDL